MSETETVRATCPECGGRVEYDLTCHTYGQGDRFYACMPCDSAVEYICASQYDDYSCQYDTGPGECTWRYTHGLNSKNPRAAENEKRRPPWIPEGQECGEWRAPGVALIGSED